MTGRTPSEERWLRVNAYCQRERHELAVRAAAGYPPGLRVAGTPLLAPPAWRLPAPVPLDGVRLEFRPDAPRPDVPDLAALAPYALPERADGTRYQRYSDVVAELAAPSVFENRPTYRLIEADLAGAGAEGDALADGDARAESDARGKAGPLLAFCRGRFFDGADQAARPAMSTPPPSAGSRPAIPTAPPSAARRASPGARRRWR